MKAQKRYVRISRRKVARLVQGCRNQQVGVVKYKLGALPQRAAAELLGTINSAAANYLRINPSYNTDELVVDNVIVDMAPSFKRMMPRARGSANVIKKKSCHIKVTLRVK